MLGSQLKTTYFLRQIVKQERELHVGRKLWRLISSPMVSHLMFFSSRRLYDRLIHSAFQHPPTFPLISTAASLPVYSDCFFIRVRPPS